MSQHFGCDRFVSNHMLERRQQRNRDKQPTSYKDDSSALTLLKKEPAYAWLNDVSSVALQQAVRHLDSAFKSFFSGRSRFPRFKRKQAAQGESFSLMRNAFTLRDGKLILAKMKYPLA